MKICLVTEELSNIGISGGIGTAFRELAIVLSKKYDVHILYIPVVTLNVDALEREKKNLGKKNIKLHVLDASNDCFNYDSAEGRSYAVYRYFKDSMLNFEVVHFHDYRGLAYFSLMARNQGALLNSASIVMQCHGPSSWTKHVNKTIYSDPSQISVDFMERKSIEWADYVISPSQYLLDFMNDNGFVFRNTKNVRVIKNVCTIITEQRVYQNESERINEIIFFGRHEDRKGIDVFCRAIDLISNEIADRGVQVTFLGRLGQVKGVPSGLFVSEFASRWRAHIKFLTKYDREASIRYLRQFSSQLVVIASKAENSPYTVAEAVSLAKPVICSIEGGGPELLHDDCKAQSLCLMEPDALAEKILEKLKHGATSTKSAQAPEDIEREWLQFHLDILPTSSLADTVSHQTRFPKVVLGITHFERPEKLQDAIFSALRQTYPNLEVVVVDDCSQSKLASSALDAAEALLSRVGGRLIRRKKNGYLGAARNTIINETESEYLIFLDDDDLAFPELVSELVAASEFSKSDITGCFNLYLNVSEREAYKLRPENFKTKVSYLPIGGPLTLAPIRNSLGSATSLMRRSTIDELGGYSEIQGVGHEDYELYVRALQSGMKISILPEPLYLYEVGRPSMISTTSMLENFHRVFKAIDFSKNQQDWKSLIEVFVGQVAAASSLSTVRNDFSDPLFADVYATQFSDSTVHMSALARWANSRGYSNLAIAWLEAIESDMLNNRLDSEKSGLHVNHVNFELLDQALSLDDGTSKGEWLFRFVSDNPYGEVLRRIRGHFENARGTVSCARMVELLEQSRHTISLSREVQNSFLSQLVSLFIENNSAEAANHIFSELLHREERSYIERYDDLFKAFDGASEMSGVRHYVRYGMSEGRFGFENILRLNYLLRADVSNLQSTDIEELVQFFGIKFRATPPRNLLFNLENVNMFRRHLGFRSKEKKKSV